LDPRLDDAWIEAGKDLQPIPLYNDEHKTYIGTSLKQDDRKTIRTTLRDNVDLFAWTATDMPGVSSEIITHHLSVYIEATSVAQKKRKLGEEKLKAA